MEVHARALERAVTELQNKAMLSSRLVFRRLGEQSSPHETDLSHIPHSLQYPWQTVFIPNGQGIHGNHG